MRRTAVLLTTLGILIGTVAIAADTIPKPLDITAADIQQAGYTHVQPIAFTAEGRWQGPTHYFTTDAYIARDDEKRDCADCRNVVAAYAAVSPTVPGWSINQRIIIRKIAGRWQGRAYLPNKKTVIVVTGPDQALIGKLLEQLKLKFGA